MLGLTVSAGIPCVRFAPRPLTLCEGDAPLCPSDISPASGGNPATFSLTLALSHQERGELSGIPGDPAPLDSGFRRNDGEY